MSLDVLSLVSGIKLSTKSRYKIIKTHLLDYENVNQMLYIIYVLYFFQPLSDKLMSLIPVFKKSPNQWLKVFHFVCHFFFG